MQKDGEVVPRRVRTFLDDQLSLIHSIACCAIPLLLGRGKCGQLLNQLRSYSSALFVQTTPDYSIQFAIYSHNVLRNAITRSRH